MPSPMEIMLGSNRDERTMKEFSDQLRRKKDISQLAMLSGDNSVGAFGSSLGADVESQVNSRISEREKGAQRDLTKGYYDQMAQQSALSNTMAQRRMSETERHNLAMENKTAQQSTKLLNTQVRNLSRDLTKAQVPEISQGISIIDEELKPYLDAEKGLPGVGGVSNILPSISSDGRKMKSVIARIRNTILKARSGGAVTPQEADRLMEEFSLTGFNSDEEFLKSWGDFKNVFSNGTAGIYAGYEPDVVDAYMMNMEAQTGNGVQNPSGSPGAEGTGGTQWDELTPRGTSSPSSGPVKWGDL